MKITIAIFLFVFLIIGLSACSGNTVQTGSPESDSSIAATVEAVPSVSPPHDEMDILEQIKNGDFSNVTELSVYESEWLKMMYDGRDNYEWVECELNGNGLKGLLWQQKDSAPLEIKRIDAIFAVKDDEARLVDSTYYRQGTECFFLSKNGNILYTYSVYGTEDYNHYTHCIFKDDWSVEWDNNLTVIRTYDWAIEEQKQEELFDKWLEEHPYWAEAGVYYFTNEGNEVLDESKFLKAFEEMTGYAFYDDNPAKPDWVNR